MGCTVALPSCTCLGIPLCLLWETSVLLLWVSTGHLTLWALMRGLEIIGRSHKLGFTDTGFVPHCQAKTTETLDKAPLAGLGFPLFEMR